MSVTRSEAHAGPLQALESAIGREGTAQAWARSAGLSPQYVADVRLGRRAPGPAILLALGLVRVVTYAPATEARS